MQCHCGSQHCGSSPCHCHRCHSDLFVAIAALFEPSLSYAVPSLRLASSSRSRAIHRISFAILFLTVLLKSTPCPCSAYPCFALALPVLASLCHCWATQIFAIPLHCRSLRLFAFAARFKSVLFLRVPNQLVALAARSAHIHAIQSRCFFFLFRSSPYRINV